MKSERRKLSTVQKFVIAAAVFALLAVLWILSRIEWTEPPCPTCHIERGAPFSGTRSDDLCYINGRIRKDFAKGPVVAELNAVVTADKVDTKEPVPGYLATDCVTIPVPCPPAATPKLEFSRIADPSVRWENSLCKGDCPVCKE